MTESLPLLLVAVVLCVMSYAPAPSTPKIIVFMRGIVGTAMCMMWAYKTGRGL